MGAIYERAKIIKPGKADCIHHEVIDGFLGTCTKCGRVKEYPHSDITDQIFHVDKENRTWLNRRWGAPIFD